MFITELNEHGGEVYIVGGAVRDLCIAKIHDKHIKSLDIDILVCKLDISQIDHILVKHGKIVKNHGIIFFNWSYNNITYDIALPRTEVHYVDHFVLNYDKNISIEDDFSRRDATINSMGIKIINETELLDFCTLFNIKDVIDPYGGLIDIKNKLWRCIGEPIKRFEEDPKRILRAFRQSAELEFDIEPNTLQSIYDHDHLVTPISNVTKFNEFLRLLNCDNPSKYMMLMFKNNIIDKIFPNELLIVEESIYDIKSTQSLLLKFCLLIKPETHHYLTLYKNLMFLQLSATNYMNHTDIKIICLISELFTKVKVNYDTFTQFNILKLMNKIFGTLRSHQQTVICIKTLFEYVKIKNNFLSNFNLLIDECKQQTYVIDELQINGTEIQQYLHVEGKMIGVIKMQILEKIIKGELLNSNKCIIEYLLHIQPFNEVILK